MIFFYNQLRSGYEEIVDMSPTYWTDIKEMDAIFSFAGWTLDIMAKDMEKVVRLQFINNMGEDIETLRRMEDFVNIADNKKEIQDRIGALLAVWNIAGDISASRIKQVIYSLIGEEHEVNIELRTEKSSSKFVITIDSIVANEAGQEEIRKFVKKMLPVHIPFEIIYFTPKQGTIYKAAALISGDIYHIRQGRS